MDAYFAVRPVFLILRQILDDSGNHLLHIITRTKRNVVDCQDPPPKTGRPGRPREYSAKLKLMDLFEIIAKSFEQSIIEIYDQYEGVRSKFSLFQQ